MYVEGKETPVRSKDYNVRRCEPRYVSSLPVTLHRFLSSGPFVTRGISLDISMGGMSALVCGAPQVGETVVIDLSLQNVPVELLATVRYSTDERSGFEFYLLSPVAQQGIQSWVQELSKHEETLFPYAYTSEAKSGNG